MASLAVKSSFCLLVALFCFALNVEAREGKLFFNRFTHHVGANKEAGPSPAGSPAPGPAQVHGRPGDGHFGPGSGMIPQTKESWPVESTTSDGDFDKLMHRFDDGKSHGSTDKVNAENYVNEELAEDFEDGEDSQDSSEQKGNNEHNNGHTYTTTSNYESNNYKVKVRGFGEERQGMSDTRFVENGNYFYDVKGGNYKNTPTTSNYERSNYNENEGGDGEERQGMSDTRFVESGESFYDGEDGNDENTPSRYQSSESAPANYHHPNEFDTMEEYYKSLEGSEESMP